jgi:DNA-binding MarR family transcriptional regulator
MKNKSDQKVDSLEQVKRLMVLALLHQGVQGKDIAAALGVDPGTVSRMIPLRRVGKKK